MNRGGLTFKGVVRYIFLLSVRTPETGSVDCGGIQPVMLQSEFSTVSSKQMKDEECVADIFRSLQVRSFSNSLRNALTRNGSADSGGQVMNIVFKRTKPPRVCSDEDSA